MTSTALYYVYQKIYDGHCTNIYRRKNNRCLIDIHSPDKRTTSDAENLFDVRFREETMEL